MHTHTSNIMMYLGNNSTIHLILSVFLLKNVTSYISNADGIVAHNTGFD